MEDKTVKEELIAQITEYFPDLNLVQYRDRIDSSVKHFEFNGMANGVRVSGFGSDHCESTALRKAFSEFLERRAFHFECQLSDPYRNSRTTSGFAAHLDLERAVAAAENELIERDAFFWMWFSKTSPRWLTEEELLDFGVRGSNILRSRLREYELSARFGIIASTGGVVTVIGLLESESTKGGYSVSTSASRNPASAIASVYFDLRRLANVFINSCSSATLSGDLPVAGHRWTSKDHFNFAMRQSRAPDWLKGGDSLAVRVLPPLGMQTGVVQRTLLPYEVWVVRASCDACFQYFLGPTNLEQVSQVRARSVGISLSELNLELHPLP